MIILMGLAGSGKSTQGQLLAAATDRTWLSAGQVLRDTNDPEINAILEQGKLAPDELTISLMEEKIAQSAREGRDVVIDGFPRNITQANWVSEHLASAISVVIVINVPKDELFQRLELRGRADDTKEAILERFRIVEQGIVEVCEILQANGIKVVQIDGMGTPEDVYWRISETVAEADNG